MSEQRMTQKEYDRRLDAIKVCGANRGPHDYIPVSWTRDEKNENVTHMMCRVCFSRIHISTLWNNFSELKL